MPSTLTSIIVPCYNHEYYVEPCIRSLYEQSYDRLELIIVDDNSNDRSFECICDTLAGDVGKRFERIETIKKPANRGAHDSLNLGMSLSHGDFLAIINSDDLFVPDRIERMIAALTEMGQDFAFSLVSPLFGCDIQASSLPFLLRDVQTQQILHLERDITVGFALLRMNVAISTGNFVFTRQLRDKVGAFHSLRYCHDWDYALRALIQTEPVAVMEPLYRYRLHASNSFQSYQDIAAIETEVVLRRFFRSILRRRTPNQLCPSPENWPGYFERFVEEIHAWTYWSREADLPVRGWRTRAV